MKLFKRKRQKTTRDRHEQSKLVEKSPVQLHTIDPLVNNRRKRDEHLKSLREIRTVGTSSRTIHSDTTGLRSSKPSVDRLDRERHLKLLRDCRTLAEVGYPEEAYPTLSSDETETSSISDCSDTSSVGSTIDRDAYLRIPRPLTESSCSQDSTDERRIPRLPFTESYSRDSTVEERSVDRYSSIHHSPSPVAGQSLTCLADLISFQSHDYWYDSKTQNW